MIHTSNFCSDIHEKGGRDWIKRTPSPFAISVMYLLSPVAKCIGALQMTWVVSTGIEAGWLRGNTIIEDFKRCRIVENVSFVTELFLVMLTLTFTHV